MSERDTNTTGSSSPYDDPTGELPVANPDVPPPLPTPKDRDSFFARHHGGHSGMSRVDDLDDLDPDEVATTRMAVPTPTTERVPAHGGSFDEPPTPVPHHAATTPIPASRRTSPPEPEPGSGISRSDATHAYSVADYDGELPTSAYADALPPAPIAGADEAQRRRRRRASGDDDNDSSYNSDEPYDNHDRYGNESVGRGTLDLGLLILRVAVGAVAIAHGMQKLFGWWNGPGLDGFEQFLLNTQNTTVGFAPDAAKPLAIVGALSETIGGLLLILGFATPLAASAVLGVMIVAATFKATVAGGLWFFATGQAGPGIEYEIFLGICAAVIILTGPGRISLDAPRKWAQRPSWGSALILLLAVGAAVTVWVIFNGSNPLDLLGNPIR